MSNADLGYLEQPITAVETEFNEKGKLPDKTIKGLIYEVGSLLTRLGISDARHETSKIDLENRHKETMVATDECHRLSDSIVTKDEELNNLRNQINDIAFKCGEATGQVNTFKEIAESAIADNKDYVEMISDTKASSARFTTERDQIKSKLEESEKDNNKILNAMTGMKERVEKLSVQNVSLANENKSFKESNTEAIAIKSKMLMERDNLKDKIIEGEQSKNHVLKELGQMEVKRDGLGREVAELKQQAGETKKAKETLVNENEKLKQEVENMKNPSSKNIFDEETVKSLMTPEVTNEPV